MATGRIIVDLIGFLPRENVNEDNVYFFLVKSDEVTNRE